MPNANALQSSWGKKFCDVMLLPLETQNVLITQFFPPSLFKNEGQNMNLISFEILRV